MEHLLSDDHEDNPNQHEKNCKLCNENEDSSLSLKEVNGNWDNNIIRISQLNDSYCRRKTGVGR